MARACRSESGFIFTGDRRGCTGTVIEGKQARIHRDGATICGEYLASWNLPGAAIEAGHGTIGFDAENLLIRHEGECTIPDHVHFAVPQEEAVRNGSDSRGGGSRSGGCSTARWRCHRHRCTGGRALLEGKRLTSGEVWQAQAGHCRKNEHRDGFHGGARMKRHGAIILRRAGVAGVPTRRSAAHRDGRGGNVLRTGINSPRCLRVRWFCSKATPPRAHS